jgi:acyl carrier protein
VNDGKLRALALRILGEIAPEAELESLDPARDLRDQLEIDSMDLLNFAIGLHQATGVEIPEADYPQLATLDSVVSYLAAKTADHRRSG